LAVRKDAVEPGAESPGWGGMAELCTEETLVVKIRSLRRANRQ
jgi:hypothetical protein